MSDLISRTDAIEAVQKKLQDWGGYAFEDYRRGLYEAQDIIESLPSAEAPTIDAKGVLVKGMEMPKNCVVCKFGDAPEFERFCIVQGYKHLGEWDKTTDRPSDCPLVEITSQAQKEISAEAVQGDWKIDEYGIYHCPYCHAINNTVYKSFCPNCGAKMTKGGDDE